MLYLFCIYRIQSNNKITKHIKNKGTNQAFSYNKNFNIKNFIALYNKNVFFIGDNFFYLFLFKI